MTLTKLKQAKRDPAMMDIATHVRIFEPQPTDELVTKRTAAVNELSAHFMKGRKVAEIFAIANQLIAALLGRRLEKCELAQVVETAIKKDSPAFILEGNELQALVCAMLGATQALNSQKPSVDWFTTGNVFGAAIWSGLANVPPCDEPKLEELRLQLVEVGRLLVVENAVKSRQRVDVPDLETKKDETEGVVKAEEIVAASAKKIVQSLRSNAVLDREELDLLWWALSDYSGLLDGSLSKAPAPLSALASCIEMGRILRRLPADAHRNLALRNVDSEAEFTPSELLRATDSHRLQLVSGLSSFAQESVDSCPLIFPLTRALKSGEIGQIQTSAKTKLLTWGARALLEASLLQMCSMPVPRV